MQDGILLIDKPKGITSYDVIRKLQQKFGRLKMGHAGTLDPRASGLMIIGVGKGTKELSKLIKLSKTYEAEILLGVATDTGDLDGKVLKEFSISNSQFSMEKIRETLKSMEGRLMLPVPAYSAIKQGGTSLYKKARRGEVLTLPEKEMLVEKVSLLDIRYEDTKIRVFAGFDVGSGTYIRSLAEELGRRLGVPATLAELRRTRIGDFKIKDAKTLDQI